jgi:hypothetical protein
MKFALRRTPKPVDVRAAQDGFPRNPASARGCFSMGSLESQARARRREAGSKRRDGTDILREASHQFFVFEAFGGVDR